MMILKVVFLQILYMNLLMSIVTFIAKHAWETTGMSFSSQSAAVVVFNVMAFSRQSTAVVSIFAFSSVGSAVVRAAAVAAYTFSSQQHTHIRQPFTTIT